MNYNVYSIENGVVIENIKDFEPEHIFECGQAFRWYQEEDKSYTGVAAKRVINIRKQGNSIIIDNTNIEDFKNIWMDYFDLSRDYGEIKEKLSQDNVLREAIKFGEGIRILKQDEWETLISFIISANNRIPMIKKAIKKISERWGKPITYKGSTYYTFPDPYELSSATEEELESCNTGFRAKYIKKVIEIVLNNGCDIYNLKNISYEEAKQKLMELPGVGPKVANCVLLFSMRHYEAFPVDVWVKRIMQYFYLAPDVSLPRIEKFGHEKFKDMAGFAQQYLFYYARDMKGKDIIV